VKLFGKTQPVRCVPRRYFMLAANGIAFDSFDAHPAAHPNQFRCLSSLELAAAIVKYPQLAGGTASSLYLSSRSAGCLIEQSRIDEDNAGRAIRYEPLSFLWHYRPASKCARGAILSLLSANRSDFVTDNDRAAILSTVRSKNNGRDTSSVDFSLSFPLFSLAKRRSRTIFPWFS